MSKTNSKPAMRLAQSIVFLTTLAQTIESVGQRRVQGIFDHFHRNYGDPMILSDGNPFSVGGMVDQQVDLLSYKQTSANFNEARQQAVSAAIAEQHPEIADYNVPANLVDGMNHLTAQATPDSLIALTIELAIMDMQLAYQAYSNGGDKTAAISQFENAKAVLLNLAAAVCRPVVTAAYLGVEAINNFFAGVENRSTELAEITKQLGSVSAAHVYDTVETVEIPQSEAFLNNVQAALDKATLAKAPKVSPATTTRNTRR